MKRVRETPRVWLPGSVDKTEGAEDRSDRPAWWSVDGKGETRPTVPTGGGDIRDVPIPKNVRDFIEGPFAQTYAAFVEGRLVSSPRAIESARRGLTTLVRSQLASLRSYLVRTAGLGPTSHSSLRGPPTVQKVLQILAGAPWSPRLDPVTKRFLRSARDQNVDALMGRAALGHVNGNDGAFRQLNPKGVDIDVAGEPVGDVEQRYLMIDLFRDMLRVGFDEEELDELTACTKVDGNAEASITGLLAEGRMRVVDRQRRNDHMKLPTGLREVDRREVCSRLSRVRWVEAELAHIAPETLPERTRFSDDLSWLLSHRNAEAVYEALDQRFEAAMNEALGRDLQPTALTHLSTVAFERIAADTAPADIDPEAAKLPEGHFVRRQLAELEARLDRGERSAVGGADYAKQTFPEEILEAAAARKLTVVAFDGDRDAGIEYIRNAYGTEKGERQGCRIMGLQGIYGSYPRSLVTLDDGSQFLLVSGYGASRQVNNSAMLMLFNGAQGRIAAEDIDLATDGGNRVEQFRANIEDAIDRDWANGRDDILGVPVKDASDIPTRLMIIQNPGHLEKALPGRIMWGEPPEDTLVPMRLAYVKKEDGSLERVIVPKVGGGGVYGDTAGEFVEAFFSIDRSPVVDDIVFNGAAGGFANTRQVPDVKPGGIIAPTKSVEEHGDGNGRMPLHTLLSDASSWSPSVRRAIEAADVVLSEHHVAVAAPSIETYQMIHDLVAADHASVDVEAGAITRAVAKLRAGGRDVTFTPVYTHSDDPRNSEHDRFDSLAMMGPLFEGSRFNKPLFDLLLALAGWNA